VQRDRDRLFAVLHLATAASAGFKFTMLVFMHHAADSFLLPRALTGRELRSIAVHTACATNEKLYRFLNLPVLSASRCRFLL
jgi:hypothetical protein